MVEQYVTVDKSNTHSAIRDNFRKAVEDNISDPTNREKRHWIYERDPHTPGTDFEDYPVIYIEDYNVTKDSETQNGYVIMYNGQFDVVIEASEDQADYFDTISDNMEEIFDSGGDPREKLGVQGISSPSIDRNTRSGGVNVNDKYIFRREMSIIFKMHIDAG